jgi:glutathione S-transferase
MLVLCGFPISNYYNKVKLALLEKNVAFTEEFVHPKNADAAVFAMSPLGKIPFIRTPQGSLCESQAIMEYIDAAYPGTPLVPAEPFAAAKMRELITFIDLHLELVARELYSQAFFGGTVSESAQARVKKQLDKNIAAFKGLVKFAPFVAGDTFTQADCAAFASLPLIGMATKAVYGEDLLLAAGIDYKPYMLMIGERPAAKKVMEDRKAAQAKASAAAAAAAAAAAPAT